MAATEGTVGLSNDGYWGMDVKKSKLYTGSFWVKGAYKGSFTASFQSNLTGDVFGTAEIASKASPSEWVEHEFELQPAVDAPNSNNTFAITFDAAVRTSSRRGPLACRVLTRIRVLRMARLIST